MILRKIDFQLIILSLIAISCKICSADIVSAKLECPAVITAGEPFIITLDVALSPGSKFIDGRIGCEDKGWVLKVYDDNEKEIIITGLMSNCTSKANFVNLKKFNYHYRRDIILNQKWRSEWAPIFPKEGRYRMELKYESDYFKNYLGIKDYKQKDFSVLCDIYVLYPDVNKIISLLSEEKKNCNYKKIESLIYIVHLLQSDTVSQFIMENIGFFSDKFNQCDCFMDIVDYIRRNHEEYGKEKLRIMGEQIKNEDAALIYRSEIIERVMKP